MSPAIEQAQRRQVYQTTGAVAQILEDVGRLEERDKHHEQRMGQWGAVAGLGGLLLVSGVILGVATSFASGVLIGGLLASGAIALIVGLVVRFQYGRGNFDDKRYRLLGKLLHLIGKDTAQEAQLQVRLDLRRPDTRDKFVSEGSAGPWKVKFYRDPWLQLQGRLLDGTSFQVAAIELSQYRSRWKTSASGKSKHKSKTKTATEAVLCLRPKITKYEHAVQFSAEAAKDAVKLPDWVALKSIDITDRGLTLKVKAKAPWNIASRGKQPERDGVHMIAMMFLSLYQILNLSRAMSKAEKKRPPQ